MTQPLVLGIETSCDETGAGLVRGHELLADSVASSVAEHARFGGVVPEVASRAHLEAMVATVDRALATAGVKLAEVDGIAVTAGPGLAGALLVGVSAAKAYALALGKPLYAVNHLAAHIAVDQLEHGPLPRPAVALLVSGGHSSLLLVQDVAGEVVPLGATIDDAAGEAYDKVARLLGMPFPGGPPVDAAARDGDGSAIAFPRGKYRDDTFDFSFSGLKTAVARWVQTRQAAGLPVPGGRRGRVLPGGRRRCPDPQGGRRLPRAWRIEPDHRRGSGRQLAAARPGGAAVRSRRDRAARAPARAVHGQRRDGGRAGGRAHGPRRGAVAAECGRRLLASGHRGPRRRRVDSPASRRYCSELALGKVEC